MRRLFAASTMALLLAAGAAQAQVDTASVDAAVQRVMPEVVAWRRDFHQHPELGFAENRSAGVIADHLRSLGLEVRTEVGKTGVIGVLRGAIQMKESSEKWGRNGAQIKGYGKITDAFLDLSSQRLDAVFLESTVGEEDFLKTGKGKGYAFVGPVFNDPKYYMGSGIAVQKGNKELLAKVNTALKKIIDNGTYKQVQNKYFSYDIYPFK